MKSARAICVSRDAQIQGRVQATLAGTGVDVQIREDLPKDTSDLALVVVDRATRQLAGDTLRALGVPVVVVGDDLDDEGLMSLMLDAPVSHHVEDPADRDLGITSEKLASGDVFGLEKYLASEAVIGERVIAEDADKRNAIGEVCAWAESIGARWPIVYRLACVVDELLMNALYDTPGAQRKSAPALARDREATLRWGADEHTIAVSVGDMFGALRQRDVIDNVRRARQERGKPQGDSESPRGAGLGLYLVIANVSSLVINVEVGRRTEVVCLFDRAQAGQRAVSTVRSLHVFRAAAAR